MPRILVSSAGGKVPLISSLANTSTDKLGKIQVIVADTGSQSLSFFFTDEKYTVSSTIQANLEAHLEFCKTHNIQIVLPTRDGELEFWATNCESFRDIGVRVSISSPDSIALCSDKLAFYNQLNTSGYSAVPTSLNLGELEGNSYVVKERFGSASQNIGLDLSKDSALSWATKLASPIFQTYVSGIEYSVDVWRSQSGDVTVCSPRTRDKVVNGEAKVTSTILHNEVENLSQKLAELLDIKGLAVLQFIIDQQGKIWIIECNARVGGATTASVAAGAPLFELLFLDLMGLDYRHLASSVMIQEITQVRAEKDFIFEK